MCRSSTGEGCLVSTFEPRKKAIPPLVCVKVIAPLRLEESNHVNFQIKWQLYFSAFSIWRQQEKIAGKQFCKIIWEFTQYLLPNCHKPASFLVVTCKIGGMP